jgi:VanZ family protein
MDRQNRIIRHWLVLYLYMVAIFIGSSISDESFPQVLGWTFMDKVAHFVEYFFLGILCIRALRISNTRYPPIAVFVTALFFCAIYALSDEIHQHFVPGRTLEMGDVLSDILGSFVGFITYGKVSRITWRK